MKSLIAFQKIDRIKSVWESIIAKKNGEILVLGLITILAFVIRYIGLKFGYPLLTHPDEMIIINPVIEMTNNHTFDAGFPYRPNLFLIFTNLIVLNIVSLIKFGEFVSITYQNNSLFFVYTSRLLIAIIGSLIPIVAWKIGKQGNIDFSLPAALFFAFFPTYVIHSHYITPDIPITFFSLIIILYCLKYVKTKNNGFLLLATFISAINTSEKYPGLISFFIIAAAIIYFEMQSIKIIKFSTIRRIVIRIFKIGLLFIFFLYLTSPTLFVEYGRTFDAIMNEARSSHLGADGFNWGENMLFYAKEFINAVNWLLILTIWPGIFFMIKKRDPGLLFFSYGLLYWIVLSKLFLHWERWALPMYIAPLLFSSYGVASFKYIPIFSVRWKQLLGYLLSGVIGVSLLLNSLSTSVKFTYVDTRYAALQFCIKNDINESNSLFETYTPFSPALGKGSDFHEQYQAGVRKHYYILSSNMYNRYQSEPEKFTQQVKNYKSIRNENTLIAEISQSSSQEFTVLEQIEAISYYFQRFLGANLPDRLMGPTIQIYESHNDTN